jgi:hypothetical protein
VQQSGQGVAHLGIPMGRRSGQVEAEAARLAAWVTVLIEAPGAEVVGVRVHADQPATTGCVEGDGLDGGIVHDAVGYQRPRRTS